MGVGGDTVSVLRVGEFVEGATCWDSRGQNDALSVRHEASAEAVFESDAHVRTDCVVSNYRLPGTDGVAFLERVRATRPSIPFVLYGDDGSEAVAEAATAADVTAYVRNAPDREDERVLKRRAVAAVAAERARADDAAKANRLLDSIFESIPVHLFVKDRTGRHVRVSRVLAEDPTAWVGKTDADIGTGSPEQAEQTLADDRHVVETGEPILDKEEYIPDRDQWFLTSKVPWRDESGAVVGIIGVARDVTASKRHREVLERQNERLDRFASMVSHDLRNPLNVASGYLELAREGDESALDRVEDALDRMNDLVDDVLTLAREGKAVVDRETVSIEATARCAWETTDCGDGTLSVTDRGVYGDPRRLRRLFENLFRNAEEHAGPAPNVVVGPLSDEAGFFVADDGPGIPESDREAVFRAGVSGAVDGTGFGLTIVRQIASAHGWTVRVTESEDGGACLEFVTG
jgi:DNA-binding NarL/FixJ family response regulator